MADRSASIVAVRLCRELCDGLHSNVHLTKLDVRLSGNQLEAFMRDYAARFATIPSLTALDLAGCGKRRSYCRSLAVGHVAPAYC